MEFKLQSIGTIHNNNQEVFIKLDSAYIEGLQALEGFSHINILWWCHGFDDAVSRAVIQTPKPYKKSPEIMGIFATRSPIRPNPIALSTVEIISIDYEKGIILIPYTDANDGTPLVDIKPYTPSMDRIDHPEVPSWCAHWPKSSEDSGDFNWEDEFLF